MDSVVGLLRIEGFNLPPKGRFTSSRTRRYREAARKDGAWKDGAWQRSALQGVAISGIDEGWT
jgi:hypothetical protein